MGKVNITARRCNLPLLKTLRRLKPKEQKKVIEGLSPKAVDQLCECVYNFMYSDFGLQEANRDSLRVLLKNRKRTLSDIADARQPVEARQAKLANQAGSGIFTVLLTTLVPLITSLIAKSAGGSGSKKKKAADIVAKAVAKAKVKAKAKGKLANSKRGAVDGEAA